MKLGKSATSRGGRGVGVAGAVLWAWLLGWVGVCFGLTGAGRAETLSAYLIGNSLSFDARIRTGVVDMATKSGHVLDAHEHIWGGHALKHIAADPDTFSFALWEGPWDEALTGRTFDALIMEPFTMPGFESTGNEEVAGFNVIANTARATSPDVRVIMYQAFPDQVAAMNYATHWDAPATPTGDETLQWNRDYFDWIAAQVQGPIEVIPVGEVLYNFDVRARAGQIDGFDSAADLYRDVRHLNNVGRYLASLTFYSVLFDDSPVGVYTLGYETGPQWPSDRALTPQVRADVQAVVWDTLNTSGPMTLPEPGVAWAGVFAFLGLRRRIGTRGGR